MNLKRFFEWLFYVRPRQTKRQSIPWAGPLLARLLSLMLGLLVVLTIIHTIDRMVFSSSKAGNFFVTDPLSLIFLSLIFLSALWAFNRAGFSGLAGVALVLFLVILPVFGFLPNDLDRILVIYAVPIVLAGFVIHPAAPIPVFLLTIVAYSFVYDSSGLKVDFNYLSLGILFVLTVLTSILSGWLSNLVRSAQQSEELQREANQQLQRLQASLRQEVEKRTLQIQTAAKTIETITTARSSAEILQRTVELLCKEMNYLDAFIYLLDVKGEHGVLSAAAGHNAKAAPARVEINQKTTVGRALLNRREEVFLERAEDFQVSVTTPLAMVKSQAVLPIASEHRTFGVLEVHSSQDNAFDSSELLALQIIAGQVAASLQNFELNETTPIDLHSISEAYRYAHVLAQGKSEPEIYKTLEQALAHAPFGVFFLNIQGNQCTIGVNTSGVESEDWLTLYPGTLYKAFANGALIGKVKELDVPEPLSTLVYKANFEEVALIPILRGEHLKAILILGSRGKQPLLPVAIQPFASLAELAVSSLERLYGELSIESRLNELEAITVTSQALASVTDLDTLFSVLHEHIRRSMGDVSFLVALYNPSNNSIRIPYMYEHAAGDQHTTVEDFPLGEGLTSILIRTRQPLMLVEDTERRAIALGAKISGKPAKSWLGCPLIVSNDVIGAIIVQDTERENAFDESDLRFLTTLSAQVAGTIYNIRLVEESRQRALQLQTAAEIARDISATLDINEVLAKAVNLIRERFNFYHAAIFLIDPVENYAIVREATGEAGAQMKRSYHKLKVGSQSIVGYVTSSGEPLVVNDTQRDATYYPNPLLPATRAEAAIPLKVGARVLGALDVQSERPFAFHEENLNVLRILADQLAVAVINSELFAETQEHLSQHRLLHHVTSAAASGTTLQEALNSAAQGLQVTLGGDRVAILLANRQRNVLKVEAVAGFSEEVKQIEVPFGQGITGWVALHQKPLRVGDVSTDPRYLQVGSNTRSEMAIPLIYRGELLGVLNVESDQLNAYSENDEELLGTLGGSLAAIIANARLLEQIRKQIDRERLLYEAASRIRRSTDIRAIVATTAAEVAKAVGARQARIVMGPRSKQTPLTENEATGKRHE
ncbi:MAG: GAF domain-containing protein [Anaerolineales bacterium]|nr:GAF domain-containing protein [Anaerolineales bacterium]